MVGDEAVLGVVRRVASEVFGGRPVWSDTRFLRGYVAVKGPYKDFRKLDSVLYSTGVLLGDGEYLVMVGLNLYEALLTEIRRWKEDKLPRLAYRLSFPSASGITGIQALKMSGNRILQKMGEILEKALRPDSITYRDVYDYLDCLLKVREIDERLFYSLSGESSRSVVESFETKYRRVWRPLFEELGDALFGDKVRMLDVMVEIGGERRAVEKILHGKTIRIARYGIRRPYGVLLLVPGDTDVIDRKKANKFYVRLVEELKELYGK